MCCTAKPGTTGSRAAGQDFSRFALGEIDWERLLDLEEREHLEISASVMPKTIALRVSDHQVQIEALLTDEAEVPFVEGIEAADTWIISERPFSYGCGPPQRWLYRGHKAHGSALSARECARAGGPVPY
ncbi:hypothetical protein SAMN05444004_1207 [Jannaschia faecimaris]|uniref:Uncharacterized protein n=1 Tax=Jannaschia faecimaris TaxID=1244108 RepID=A0A1H3TVF5_9RHOB|nr:hypothetical protein SAMN05444004_1207 [Jannaschia faecimaris]